MAKKRKRFILQSEGTKNQIIQDFFIRQRRYREENWQEPKTL